MDVELLGIDKRFPGVQALHAVDLELRAGEVHALVGQNGAGKSTLIKILTGALRPDAGSIRLDGSQVRFHSPATAERAGIAVVHQENQLFPDLSVADNITVAHPPSRLYPPFRIRDRAKARKRARELLHRLHIDVDVRALAGTLAPAERKLIEVARALAREARVLVLDEPTSALERDEIAHLLRLVRRLRDEGTAVLFVSHKLEEVLEASDRVTVLRDGAVVEKRDTASLSLHDLIRLVAQAEVGEVRKLDAEVGEPVLAARGVTSDAGGPVDLDVCEREIVGLTGLLGSGATGFARSLAGVRHYHDGEVVIGRQRIRPGSPAAAISSGLGFVAEDRKAEGIVPELSVERNIALGSIRSLSRWGWLSRRKMRIQALKYIAALDIRPRVPNMPAGNLSGGNQQKVLLARWLASGASVLVLEEPTHGIDVGAKAEIQELLHRYAVDGGAVVLVSRETAEYLGLADRIGVFRAGSIAAVLPRGASEREIAAHAHGAGASAS
jgi:ABC-type sugar transport system ATPase subunit